MNDMKTFYRCTNNGIIAVVSEVVFGEIERHKEMPARPYPKPIFTFARAFLAEYKPWVTGTYEQMDILLRDHLVVNSDFFVPFSNGIELTGSAEDRQSELGFCTTLGDILETFEVELSPVLRTVAN